jgi:HK97 family phage major capsid protein
MTENRIERVPALSAVRTIPAALAPWRYKMLPEWQRNFRSADSDVAVQHFLKAIAGGERADLLQGDPAGGGEPMDGTVGQLVPLPLSEYIKAALYKFSKMHQMARILTSPSGSLRVPYQTEISVSSWEAEGAALDGGNEPATEGDLNLVLQKLTSIATISNEALEDAFGLAEWLTLDVAKEMGQEEDDKMYGSGTGTGEPRRFEVMSTTATLPTQFYVPTETQLYDQGVGEFAARDNERPTEIDYPHIQEMFFSLPEHVRSAAVWTGNDLIEEALMNMIEGDATAGSSQRPMFQMQEIPIGTISDGIANTPTPNIFGRPFVNMPGALDTSGTPAQNENRLYLVDMRRSYVILMKDLRVDRSGLSGSAFANDQTQFRFVHRIDGQPFERFASSPNISTGDFSQSTYVYTGSITGQGFSGEIPT